LDAYLPPKSQNPNTNINIQTKIVTNKRKPYLNQIFLFHKSVKLYLEKLLKIIEDTRQMNQIKNKRKEEK